MFIFTEKQTANIKSSSWDGDECSAAGSVYIPTPNKT